MKKYFIILINYLTIIFFPIVVIFFIPFLWYEMVEDILSCKSHYDCNFKTGEKFLWQS